MRKMMHLRVVAGTGGGPEKTILNSPRFIKQHGYDAHVVYLCPSDPVIQQSLRSRAEKLDCPLTLIEDRGLRDFSVIGKLWKFCREQQIELFQAHDYKSNALGLVLRRLHRMHLITMLHGWTDMSGRMPLYKRVDQWCLPWYKKHICVSEDLVQECRRLKIPDRKIELVHNAIDLETYTRWFDKKQAQDDMGFDSQLGPMIGMVCRLSPEKGILEAIAMVDRFRTKGKPVQLWIAGEGPFRSEIEKEISRLGLGANVRLLGQLADARVFYQAMDVFLLNSIREGLPNVVLEAMALEVPVVATRVAGVPTLVKPGQTGWLIEPGETGILDSAVAECLEGSHTDPQVRGARELIENQFSFDRRMQRIAGIYDSFDWRSAKSIVSRSIE
jgi:glycosyltransferase involved in cell wall biosynthesis